MVTIESALQVINQYGGNLDMTTGKLNIPSKVLGKEEIKRAVKILKEAGPDKVKAVLASVQAYCRGAHTTTPDRHRTTKTSFTGAVLLKSQAVLGG